MKVKKLKQKIVLCKTSYCNSKVFMFFYFYNLVIADIRSFYYKVKIIFIRELVRHYRVGFGTTGVF